MTHEEISQMLMAAGFNNGWALSGTELILWEHDAEPPAPLTRPVAEKSAKTVK